MFTVDRRTTIRFAHALEKAPEGGASVTHKEVVCLRCSSRGEFEDLILVQFSHFLFRSFLHSSFTKIADSWEKVTESRTRACITRA